MTDDQWDELWDRMTSAFGHHPSHDLEVLWRDYIEARLSYREATSALEKVIEARTRRIPSPSELVKAHKHTEEMRVVEGEAILRGLFSP